MAMSKYETIIWEEKMKEQIVSLARATYKDSFSNGSVFDVIYSTRKFTIGGFGTSTPDGVDTHLIVYKSPPSVRGDMEILITIESASTARGLEVLKQQMQDQLGRSLELAKDLLAVSGDKPVYYDVIGGEVKNAEVAVEDARRWRIRDALGDLWMKFHAR
ncbi:uncharacterized protein J4E84_008815 [Alternaria hordeiaustralica]|uniref:uncharacterized protein n=1 Tax=Alternaria hordeiaustralica TaxID=1187925 RepID=UPI0020C38B4E|nr:uncharacterized protein J4E84_008815 [Alternaria hordeiaustralica]KAI4677870.1 hypothetical protein J4E84_008815 [Alternaria hordeiaustralica]